MTKPICLVLDTNVCLDLFVFDDPACTALTQSLASGRCVAYCDGVCRGEWLRVLDYPKLRLSTAQQRAAATRYDAHLRALPIAQRRAPISLPRCADEDDQKFLELAYAATADVLLSRDKALLRLAKRNAQLELFPILGPRAFIEQYLSTSVEHLFE